MPFRFTPQREVLLQTRARPRGDERLVPKRAPPTRTFPLAINGCTVNRQLSMTRPQALPPPFFLLAPSVDRLSRSLKKRSHWAKTEDSDRAVTSAVLLPISFVAGVLDHRGA